MKRLMAAVMAAAFLGLVGSAGAGDEGGKSKSAGRYDPPLKKSSPPAEDSPGCKTVPSNKPAAPDPVKPGCWPRPNRPFNGSPWGPDSARPTGGSQRLQHADAK